MEAQEYLDETLQQTSLAARSTVEYQPLLEETVHQEKNEIRTAPPTAPTNQLRDRCQNDFLAPDSGGTPRRWMNCWHGPRRKVSLTCVFSICCWARDLLLGARAGRRTPRARGSVAHRGRALFRE